MKLLLALVMTTALSASAFGACSVSTAKDCNTKSECEGLSKEGGLQFRFDEASKSQKCMSVASAEGATNCIQTHNSSMAKTMDSTGGGSTGGASATAK